MAEEGVIRPMERRDVSDVHTIEVKCFSSPWSRSAIAGELKNDVAHYHVLEQGGVIMGYAGMWVLFEEAHITNVAVLPEYRGRGNGEKLMLSMMESALMLGASMMTLEVREHNEIAQNLYRKLDFVQNGYRPRYYQDTGEGALILWNRDIQNTLKKNGRN